MPESEDLENVGWRAFEGLLTELEKKNPLRVQRARETLRKLIGPGRAGESPSGVHFLYQVLETEEAIAPKVATLESAREMLGKLQRDLQKLTRNAYQEAKKDTTLYYMGYHSGQRAVFTEIETWVGDLIAKIDGK